MNEKNAAGRVRIQETSKTADSAVLGRRRAREDSGQRKSPRRQTLAFLDKENPQGADIHILSRIRNLNN